MAPRRLPSGKWQETVRLPDGKRITRTHELKKVVVEWKRQTLADIDRNRWSDPRSSRMLFKEWRLKYVAGKSVDESTARGDEVCFRLYIAPTWDKYFLNNISPADIRVWLKTLEDQELGQAMRRKTFNLFRACLNTAVNDGLLQKNPANSVVAPKEAPHVVQWLTHEQVGLICVQLPERHRVMAQLMAWSGLRWGEAAGLRVGDVDWLRRRATINQTVSQTGKVKTYAKTSKSLREVPVPAEVIMGMSRISSGKDQGDLIFTTLRGNRPYIATNWRNVWDKAVEDAGLEHVTPHVLRHTAASWLVQAGVPLYEVSKLLGHASMQVTMRYAHLAPDAHGAVEGAWERMNARTDDARTQSHTL